jgi:hypothetical protein
VCASAPLLLQDAKQRESAAAVDQPGLRRAAVSWVQGDALDLPFPDASFDAATMGYGLRNVADIPQVCTDGCSYQPLQKQTPHMYAATHSAHKATPASSCSRVGHSALLQQSRIGTGSAVFV